MQSDPRGRLTDFTAKRIASPGVRERPIGLTDRTLKSVRPCSDSHGLSPQSHVICLRVRAGPPTASHLGLPRPHRFESLICEADL